MTTLRKYRPEIVWWISTACAFAGIAVARHLLP